MVREYGKKTLPERSTPRVKCASNTKRSSCGNLCIGVAGFLRSSNHQSGMSHRLLVEQQLKIFPYLKKPSRWLALVALWYLTVSFAQTQLPQDYFSVAKA
jgi:hypothetical protein